MNSEDGMSAIRLIIKNGIFLLTSGEKVWVFGGIF